MITFNDLAWENCRWRSGARFVHVDEHLFQAALDLFPARSDKGWSLTDCISFTGMSRIGVTDALSTDHHFIQAGFHLVLEQQGLP